MLTETEMRMVLLEGGSQMAKKKASKWMMKLRKKQEKKRRERRKKIKCQNRAKFMALLMDLISSKVYASLFWMEA